ncbi:MAG: TetR/AcrR family transcriptional regulator [Rhodospirillales bacterium]|nr:TetR/AcrR family transcriptional regulator [Rhodospirillales bacterium]
MPRTRQFDEADVLDRAMALFWRQGFEATSIQDLVAALGINRASMYAAFGDKRGLFLAVIDRYLAHSNAERLAILAAPGPARAAIAAFLAALLAEADSTGPRRGCLVTNTLIEMAPRDPEIARRLRASLARVEEGFAEAIRRGQAAGEIAATRDPGALARYLVGIAQGIRVLARGGAGADQLRDVAGVALDALGPAKAA